MRHLYIYQCYYGGVVDPYLVQLVVYQINNVFSTEVSPSGIPATYVRVKEILSNYSLEPKELMLMLVSKGIIRVR